MPERKRIGNHARESKPEKAHSAGNKKPAEAGSLEILEAWVGIEPAYAALQAAA